jgi:ATP-binding cassette, subfamily F, member 3
LIRSLKAQKDKKPTEFRKKRDGPMIQVTDVSMSHGDQLLFDNVSFTINPGERCSLVGRNGSGKTTLLRLIIGQESPDSGHIAIPKGYRVGYLDQHIRFSRPTVIEEAVLGLREEERDSVYKAEKILFGLGFKEESLSSSPDKLSGGFHLRLHLAKALLSEPNCLALDEPTNYLDILSMRFLTRFLQKWVGELIIVSHDREFMDSISTHTLGIHRNNIRKVKGSTADLFGPILLEEETYEKTRETVERKRAHMQAFVEKLGAKATKAAQAQSRKKMLEKIPALEALKAIEDLEFHFHEAPFQGKKIGEVKELSFSYHHDQLPLIKELSFVIGKGEKIAIIGKNGYGKSTLLRLLAQELQPQHGTVAFSEQVSIGYFGQTHIQRLQEEATIETEIASANPELPFSEVRRICAQMMFRGTQPEKKIRVLSGGEKSRVLLGKILSKSCNLLLLDEPTHHLDVESVEALIDAIEESSSTVIIVTHSELVLERLALSKLIVCHAGKQELYTGGYEEFLEKVGWQEESLSAKPKAKVIDRADEKRKRAELVAQRSKALKPIKDEMNALETAIISLEEAQKKDQQLLEQITSQGAVQHMQELLITIGKRTKEIEQLFEKLLVLGDQYETKKSSFDAEA